RAVPLDALEVDRLPGGRHGGQLAAADRALPAVAGEAHRAVLGLGGELELRLGVPAFARQTALEGAQGERAVALGDHLDSDLSEVRRLADVLALDEIVRPGLGRIGEG